MTDEDFSARPHRLRPSWVLISAVVLLLFTAGAAILVLRSLRDLGETATGAVGGVLRDTKSLLAAFRQGTISYEFESYTTRVQGNRRLQIATINQNETFTRRDESTILWGAVELPEVVVSARAPVTYTAYLDLEEPWSFELHDRTVRIVAPPIRFNKPAIDAARIEYEVDSGSIWRDEEAARQELKRSLTALSYRRALESAELVRETARRETAAFVREWLLHTFRDAQEFELVVVFADEATELSRPSFEE